MKCANCGAELVEGAKFCGSCGAPVTASVVVEAVPVVEAAPAPEAAPQPEVKATTPQAQEYIQQMAAQQQVAEGVPLKKSIWTLVLGCAGLGSFWTAFLGPIGFVSIIICIIGLIIGGKAKKENPANKMGKTGRILALIGLIISAILTIITTIGLIAAMDSGLLY